jgi:hypothetical protein
MQAWHITWVTHNARVSQRMVDYKVRKKEGVWLDRRSEFQITKYIKEVYN